MASGYAQPWFYGMFQAFSMSRNHLYTALLPEDLQNCVEFAYYSG